MNSTGPSSSIPLCLRIAFTPARPLLWSHGEEVLALVQHLSGGDRVRRVPGEHLGQRALPRAVRPHDRVHLARVHREIDALEDLPTFHRGMEVSDFENHLSRFPFPLSPHPTLPSRLMPSSRCASTANSIGSSLKTSLQKPFTIIETASSAERPRCFA